MKYKNQQIINAITTAVASCRTLLVVSSLRCCHGFIFIVVSTCGGLRFFRVTKMAVYKIKMIKNGITKRLKRFRK